MSFNFEQIIGGNSIIFIATLVNTHIAFLVDFVYAYFIVAEVPIGFGVFQTDHISRINQFGHIFWGFLAIVDHLPLVEVGGTVSLKTLVHFLRVGSASRTFGSINGGYTLSFDLSLDMVF
jgi:hypothetical protein